MTARVQELALRYTAAWNSQDAASVAACYSLNGSLTVNSDPPAVGRGAITHVAQGFMTAFPDLKIRMDSLDKNGDQYFYRWTLDGTNTGPGGTGNRVHISGFEEWRIAPDGLVGESFGHFDSAEYQHQLEAGVDES
jgi:ketosteroid isomerase-like protein